MKLVFDKKYLFPALVIFLIEISIALFVNDRVVRPFIGDALVVVLIYCAVRIFLNVNYPQAALGVLLFACAIEVLQYFDYVKLLGLEKNRVLSVALGRTFEWLDFAAYCAGFWLIIFSEKLYERYQTDPARRRTQ